MWETPNSSYEKPSPVVDPVKQETVKKLDNLQQDVENSKPAREIAPESNESKSPFDRVFDGTRSEVFSRENRETLGKIIDGAFDAQTLGKLTPEQRENIRLAMTDRLLKDPKIQGLFDMKIGLVDILGHMAKGEVREAMDTDKAKESAGQLDRIMQVFYDQVKVAAKPLAELLKSNKSTTSILLSNPRAIAEYNGGEIISDVTQMNQSDLNQYITGLNGDVRKIDNKIFPMEEIKEKGMNFVANGPDILVRFFKWLLSFDIIANLLGYKGTQAEREAMFDDERRERRSLNVLREFGRVTDMEGKEKDGEYTGKIDILKGKDLSGIKRKKLKDFFTFTREEGINDATPDFWIGIFNDGKIVKKSSKGKNEAGQEVETKDQEYAVDKIEEKDFEKNFEGLYGKLNKLKVTRDVMNAKEEQKQTGEKEEQVKQEQEAKEKQEKADMDTKKTKEEAEKNRLKPFADLYHGSIDKELMQKISNINIESLSNGGYKTIVENTLQGEKNTQKKEVVLAELTMLISVINGLRNGNKMEAFQNKWLKKWEKLDMSLQNIYFHRQYLLAELGYTKEYLHIGDTQPQTVAVATSSPVVPQSPVAEKKVEEKPTADIITKSINDINSDIPITEISVGSKKITFNSNTQLLWYNGDFYHIELPEKKGYKIAEVYKTDKNMIQFKPISDSGSIPLENFWPKPGGIDEFSQGLMTMISTWTYEKKNDKNEVIMRITKA